MSHGTRTTPLCGNVIMLDGRAYDCTQKDGHEGRWHMHAEAARQAGRRLTARISWAVSLEAELREMERTDPVVGEAARRLDEAVESIRFRARHGIETKRFKKGCGQ